MVDVWLKSSDNYRFTQMDKFVEVITIKKTLTTHIIPVVTCNIPPKQTNK